MFYIPSRDDLSIPRDAGPGVTRVFVTCDFTYGPSESVPSFRRGRMPLEDAVLLLLTHARHSTHSGRLTAPLS